MPERAEVEIDGRRVGLSSLDRVIWPEPRITKKDLVEYYVRVGPTMLAHLAGHPLTLHRFPEGVSGAHFFQTRTPPHPDWIRTVTMTFDRTGKEFEACVIDDLAGVVWAANLVAIELHPFLGLAGSQHRPTSLVFDLDPGSPATLVHCCRVAMRLRAMLEDLGLVALAKTSGGLGLHVHVPLNSSDTYDDTKPFARAVAALLTKEQPDEVTDRMARGERAGKVFIDWGQNDPGKSTIVPYSLRAERYPTVATPVTWNEVERAATTDDSGLIFGPGEVLDRLAAAGDLFQAAAELEQSVAGRGGPQPARAL